MLQFLNRCSRGRGAWLLMALTAFLLELTALYFQHIMLLQPCVMCIYERVALFGILGASLLGAIAPRSPLRYLAIAVWIYSAWKGVQLAWAHTMLQLNPSPFNTCDFFVNFPSCYPWIMVTRRVRRQWRLLGKTMAVYVIRNATMVSRYFCCISGYRRTRSDQPIC